jgi:Bacterial type III secretion protein (HrpB1_HrpK)
MAKRHGVDLKITRLLLLVGIMCAELGRVDEAEQVVRGVQSFRDDIPHPGTVLGLIYMRQKRLQEAEEELDAVRRAHPQHQLAKALLGMVYREGGQAAWRQVLREVIEDGREEWSIRLARSVLGADAPAATQSTGDRPLHCIPPLQRLYA